jgi:signal transduction histidine kinase
MRKGPGGKNGANHVTGIIGLSMDMTKMHATELELRERERQNRILLANENAAKEASKLKSDFLASMSHEIRTPIAGVVGMCEILLDTALSTEQRELTEGIQRSANTLLTVINDILDLSKVESGKLDIEEVQFNLSLVIRDVVKMLSFEAERKKLQFKYEIDFPCPNDLTVMGDPGRVRQILANLLSNALKFTHKGSVELKARMKYQGEEMMEIHFVINDTGIGILETDQCRLFQPFTQADSSTARRFGGTGLGLSICQKVSPGRHPPSPSSLIQPARQPHGWHYRTVLESRRGNFRVLRNPIQKDRKALAHQHTLRLNPGAPTVRYLRERQ